MEGKGGMIRLRRITDASRISHPHYARVPMLRHICWSVVALVGLHTTAGAQQSLGVSGTWTVRSVVGANDSVLIIFALTIAADGKSAIMNIPHEHPQ